MSDDELNRLLSETPSSAANRAATTYATLGGTAWDRVVLYGAGELGRRTLPGLRKVGIEPCCFADQHAPLWGTTVDGVRVLSPAEAFGEYGRNTTWVVTVWRGNNWRSEGRDRFDAIRAKLYQMGVSHVAHAGHLFWRWPETFLPWYAMDLPQSVLPYTSGVRQAFALMADDESRRTFVELVRWRLHLDFGRLSPPSRETEYFPESLVKLGSEVYVDGGAYDGDTLKRLVSMCDFKRAICFEPDLTSFNALCRTMQGMDFFKGRLVAHQMALGERFGRTVVRPSGRLDSKPISPEDLQGRVADIVPMDTLDRVLVNECPTYVKLDVEGAEPAVLRGAQGVIMQCRPVLAVCVYHAQAHLWQIPLMLAQPGYKLFLRAHSEEGWDTVCYAIPEERVL